jgi:cyclopropane-fatty-acyl-phospholipid synthase
MANMSSTLHKVASTLSGWSNAFFGQTLGRARLNAMASYDQSNELFRVRRCVMRLSRAYLTFAQAFLSEEMMYSCALWGPEEGGVRGDLELAELPGTDADFSHGALEAAQARKIAHLLAALRVPPGGRVLEFGSGWGGVAIAIALAGGEVDTLTLSIEQKRLAEERVRAAGLEGRVRVHLMDYREVPREWEGKFDAFVSVEMLEVESFHHHPRHCPLNVLCDSTSGPSTTLPISALSIGCSRRRTPQR